MNEEIKLVYNNALEYVKNLTNNKWNWDCDKVNDYFALYDDEYTISFSYTELLDGNISSATIIRNEKECDRYCTVAESIEQSLKEAKLMREGKIPKTTWDDFMKELEEEGYLG